MNYLRKMHQEQRIAKITHKMTNFIDASERRLKADYADYKSKVAALQADIDRLDQIAQSLPVLFRGLK